MNISVMQENLARGLGTVSRAADILRRREVVDRVGPRSAVRATGPFIHTVHTPTRDGDG